MWRALEVGKMKRKKPPVALFSPLNEMTIILFIAVISGIIYGSTKVVIVAGLLPPLVFSQKVLVFLNCTLAAPNDFVTGKS